MQTKEAFCSGNALSGCTEIQQRIHIRPVCYWIFFARVSTIRPFNEVSIWSRVYLKALFKIWIWVPTLFRQTRFRAYAFFSVFTLVEIHVVILTPAVSYTYNFIVVNGIIVFYALFSRNTLGIRVNNVKISCFTLITAFCQGERVIWFYVVAYPCCVIRIVHLLAFSGTRVCHNFVFVTLCCC